MDGFVIFFTFTHLFGLNYIISSYVFSYFFDKKITIFKFYPSANLFIMLAFPFFLSKFFDLFSASFFAPIFQIIVRFFFPDYFFLSLLFKPISNRAFVFTAVSSSILSLGLFSLFFLWLEKITVFRAIRHHHQKKQSQRNSNLRRRY